MLTRLFYISEITPHVSDLDIQVILSVSQVNNRRRDVTGMLAQSDGHFAQVLEGRADVVRELSAKIALDSRHRAIRTLLHESIVTRQFARWAMGLIRRDDLADLMLTLHTDGCENNAEARRLIQLLMTHAS